LIFIHQFSYYLLVIIIGTFISQWVTIGFQLWDAIILFIIINHQPLSLMMNINMI